MTVIKTRELTKEEEVDLNAEELLLLLVEKRIVAAKIKGIADHDDTPFLWLKFEDGTKVIIVASYGRLTGKSLDEYRRYIEVYSANSTDTEVEQ